MSDRARAWTAAAISVAALAGVVVLGWNGQASNAPAAVESSAPAYSAPSLAGDTVSLAAHRGHVVLLNIWATWCPPCRMEMPSLQRLYDRYHAQGLDIVAVAVDDPPGGLGGVDAVRPLVRGYVQARGIRFPILLDPSGGTENLFGATGLPTTIVIDRKGIIRGKVVGGREWDTGPLEARIRALVEE